MWGVIRGESVHERGIPGSIDHVSKVPDDEQACPSCGLRARSVDGPTDPYHASSPACWEAFGNLDLVGASQLAVDTYMAQHPGIATSAGRRSVFTHLVGLHLALHAAENPSRIRQLLGVVFPDKGLEAPSIDEVPDLRGLTVCEVLAAAPEARDARQTDWAGFVWDAWSAEHDCVADLVQMARLRLR
jgi:hypothetical protein